MRDKEEVLQRYVEIKGKWRDEDSSFDKGFTLGRQVELEWVLSYKEVS